MKLKTNQYQKIYEDHLKLKNDRNRLCSLAEEGILLMAAVIEYVFDGEKEYFGTNI